MVSPPDPLDVLVADDEPVSALLVSAVLEQLGHRVTVVADGAEAWRRFAELEPDVVITDWDMPELGGTELTRRIRASDSPYAYVLVLTGRADEAAARDAMHAGADDLALKPIDAADLERKLIAARRVTEAQRRLHRDARQDALTGIGNRRRLVEDLDVLWARRQRYGHSCCIALLDLDRFKAYNDGAGHQAGDEVLRTVARALASTLRAGDGLYRYGGEELLALLPEQSLALAAQAAERLRGAVEALALPHPAGGRVTVSVGVAADGEGCDTPDALIAAADAALYRAKAAGRNRVETHAAEAAADAIRLLVADDDPATLEMLSAMAQSAPGLELVGAARDAEQALALAEDQRPDVVLLDVNMPGGGGVRAAVDIARRQPRTRIVALSADDSPEAMMDMSRAGAVGYVFKGASPEEIVRAIHSSARW